MAVTSTVFREAVAAHLAEALGVRFESGQIAGPIERRDLGCSFPAFEEENSDNTIEEILTITVRVFQAYVQQTAAEKPADPAKLEGWSLAIKTALMEPWGSLGVWFARVTRVEYDMETQGIEVTIIGWQDNPQAVS